MNKKPPKKAQLIAVMTGTAIMSLGCIPIKPANAVSTPEYTFERSSFFCKRLQDAEEMNTKLYYTKEHDSLIHLVKSDRCVLINMVGEDKITNVGLIDTLDYDNPNKNMCKVRITFNGGAADVWTSCMGLLKGGAEPYAAQVTGGVHGWGGTW